MTFLQKNPQRVRQYNYPRRGGGYTAPQITLHTYEAPYTRSLLAAATWLTQRTDYGSYHALCGARSPQDVLQLAPWSYETFHSAPTNNWSIGISAVHYAHQWRSIPTSAANNLVDSMAYASANAAQWLLRHHGRVVQPRLLTRAQAMRKESGFVHHRITDPGRRTDPANPQSHFPWTRFINRFNALMEGETDMPLNSADLRKIRDLIDERVGNAVWAHRDAHTNQYMATHLRRAYEASARTATAEEFVRELLSTTLQGMSVDWWIRNGLVLNPDHPQYPADPGSLADQIMRAAEEVTGEAIPPYDGTQRRSK